ncbi:hypothetical protein ABW20_dc0101719 [Dactylellina cionopaga]|nr:hypothetical protein ABW20_dc0101719 [Dactylellina cionopaga]
MEFPQPFPPSTEESPASLRLIKTLSMLSHPEGGYYIETDRSRNHIISNPFLTDAPRDPFAEFSSKITVTAEVKDDSTRMASTTIFYLLTKFTPKGHFHRNKARTMHLHHRGRARYVILHADEWDGTPGTCRVESWVVGADVEGGERLQWMVEGGKYKASYLLADHEEGKDAEVKEGCLISEVVVPGFEFSDHDFLAFERLVQLVGEEKAEEMRWLVRTD